jgi:methionine aminopeptidase
MMDVTTVRARVGGHNGRCIYFDSADKPVGERGGGADALVAITVGETEAAEELARWIVDLINAGIDVALAEEKPCT